MRRLRVGDDLATDLRYSARAFRSRPAFAFTAVLTLALGIGAAMAMFSVTSAVLLRPLPYRNSGRLVLAGDPLSNAYFFDLRNGARDVFDEMTTVMVFRAIVPREDGGAERISKGLVMPNFFGMLGVRVIFGRDFTAIDGQPHGPPPPPFPVPPGSVAILSYDYFQRRYGANAAVLGRSMEGLAGAPGPRIIGVLDPGFRLFLPDSMGPQPGPDVWIANDRGYDAANRGGLMLQFIGRLRSGVTLTRAQSAVDRIAASWGADHPAVRLQRWHDALVNDVRPALLALMGAVIFLLLIACANTANLLLVRASARQRELAVRAALGAGAGRIGRQILAEALVLCGLGTVFGVAIAWVGIRELLALAPANLPRVESTSIDWRVLAFAALAGIVESVLLAALPAWRAVRPDIAKMLRSGAPTMQAGAGRLRSAVVVAEVALSFVLLIGSGLMFRSFLELRRVNPGFDPHGLLTFFTIGDARGYDQLQRRLAFIRELQNQLRSIPGVRSVGGAVGLPLHPIGLAEGTPWSVDRTAANPARTADIATVLPGYFEALRTRLLDGRTFTEADNAAGSAVAVIDDPLAAKAFPGQSAVGRRICVYAPDAMCAVVIGVVEHQRIESLAHLGREQVFLSDGFFGMGISRHWALRTDGDPAMYAAAVRAAVAKFAPGRLAVTEMETMDTTIGRSQAPVRFDLLLIGIFGAVSAALTGVGLFGVISSAAGQRTAEIGVRMALGAAPRAIFRMIVGQGLALAATGVVIGVAAALGFTRAMKSMLVGIRPTDPAVFVSIAAVFLLLAGLACWLPAHRAAALDPTSALRAE